MSNASRVGCLFFVGPGFVVFICFCALFVFLYQLVLRACIPIGSFPKAQQSCHPCSIERWIRDGIRNAVFTGVAVHLVLVLAITAFGSMGRVRSVAGRKSSMP